LFYLFPIEGWRKAGNECALSKLEKEKEPQRKREKGKDTKASSEKGAEDSTITTFISQ